MQLEHLLVQDWGNMKNFEFKQNGSAYELTENGTVTVDYNDYLDGGFAKMEELDAFCATSSVTVTNQKIENKQKSKFA